MLQLQCRCNPFQENPEGDQEITYKDKPKMTSDIMTSINEKYDTMSKGHKLIAAYIQENSEEAVFMTAARLGETVGVSESTVVRFASAMGYEGYSEFQEVLVNWVKHRLGRVQKLHVKYKKSGQSEILASVLAADRERIRETEEQLDGESFEMAVNAILEAETVYVVGLRSCGPLAELLYFYLNMLGEHCVLVKTTCMSEMFEQMMRIREKDALIGISFPRYSMRTLKAMEFANDRNAKVIAITDSIHSPMNLYSSCNLLASSHAASIVDSLVAPLSLINALIVTICVRQPDKVRKNLTQLEEVWNNYQVYLNDEMDAMNQICGFGSFDGSGKAGVEAE